MKEFNCHSRKQNTALFSDKKIVLCATGIQWGKGLHLDCPVIVYNEDEPLSYKRAGDININDIFIDRDFKPTKILGIYPQGKMECCRIDLQDDNGLEFSIITDHSHLNIVIDPLTREERVVSTKDLLDLKFFWKGRRTKSRIRFLSLWYKDFILNDIDDVGIHETVCFKVESPTSSFAIINGLVTHNTAVGAVWARKRIHSHWSPNNNFLVTSPTYKIMKQSTLPAFLNIMGGLGRYNQTDATYTIKDGPTIYFRSGTHPDSVVGITNVEGIWCDEAGKYSLYFWENIQARSSFRGCPVIITTSPYSLNWIYKELITAVQKGKRLDEIELIQAASYENPYFPKAEYERKKKTMDPRRFNMVYGGEWGKHEGLVYDCFNADEMEIDPYQFPSGTKFYGGIDWGHRDPFVLIIRAITPYGYKIEVSETYKPGLRPSQIKEILIQKHNLYNVLAFYADPSRPDLIAELQADKIPVIGADNSIQKGIDIHYELIKSGNYKIIRGSCPNLIDEYETYHYSEEKDLQPDQNSYKSKEIPVDQSNHAMDACRYLTVGTHTTNIKLQPKLPDVLSKNKFKFHD